MGSTTEASKKASSLVEARVSWKRTLHTAASYLGSWSSGVAVARPALSKRSTARAAGSRSIGSGRSRTRKRQANRRLRWSTHRSVLICSATALSVPRVLHAAAIASTAGQSWSRRLRTGRSVARGACWPPTDDAWPELGRGGTAAVRSCTSTSRFSTIISSCPAHAGSGTCRAAASASISTPPRPRAGVSAAVGCDARGGEHGGRCDGAPAPGKEERRPGPASVRTLARASVAPGPGIDDMADGWSRRDLRFFSGLRRLLRESETPSPPVVSNWFQKAPFSCRGAVPLLERETARDCGR
mmetsp:Transcript_39271/g.90462  ORF Transcript_39271/g.90462 Transcript_39271/m.90462 type:complete len:299 (-) Transcript_39271:150-1046(-)